MAPGLPRRVRPRRRGHARALRAIGPAGARKGLKLVVPIDSTEPVIREALAGEFGAVGDLTVEAYRTIDPDLGTYEDELRDVAGHAAGAIVLVAVMAGRVVGTVTYVGKVGSPLSESTDPDAADIRMLAVAPGAAGRGIGTALVVRCIDLARAERRRRLLLLTRESMLAAQRIYGRLGFVRAPWMDKPLSGGRRLLGYALELGQS